MSALGKPPFSGNSRSDSFVNGLTSGNLLFPINCTGPLSSSWTRNGGGTFGLSGNLTGRRGAS